MRRMLECISPVLLVSVTVGALVVMSALPATAERPSDRLDHLHAVRRNAAIHNDPLAGPDVALPVAAAAEQPPPEEAPDPAPVVTVAPASPATDAVAPAPSSGGCSDDVSCFLECTRAHESDSSGGYAAVSRSGTYRGAYQFDQATWDAAVAGSGNAEYAGVPADQAPPDVQDAAAAHLYEVSGNRPWGGRC